MQSPAHTRPQGPPDTDADTPHRAPLGHPSIDDLLTRARTRLGDSSPRTRPTNSPTAPFWWTSARTW